MARKTKNLWVTTTLLTVALLFAWVEAKDGPPGAATDGAVERLFESRSSGVVVEGSGQVERLLPDDLHGSRHQRFLLRLRSGRTLLVSHNIDLAPRVAGIRPGDTVGFRGQYEWNDRGGVVHWTHYDPQGKRPGGWLRHEGQTYR